MVIYSGCTHEKLWLSICMLVCKRVMPHFAHSLFQSVLMFCQVFQRIANGCFMPPLLSQNDHGTRKMCLPRAHLWLRKTCGNIQGTYTADVYGEPWQCMVFVSPFSHNIPICSGNKLKHWTICPVGEMRTWVIFLLLPFCSFVSDALEGVPLSFV